jgi:hypothetical protein
VHADGSHVELCDNGYGRSVELSGPWAMLSNLRRLPGSSRQRANEIGQTHYSGDPRKTLSATRKPSRSHAYLPTNEISQIHFFGEPGKTPGITHSPHSNRAHPHINEMGEAHYSGGHGHTPRAMHNPRGNPAHPPANGILEIHYFGDLGRTPEGWYHACRRTRCKPALKSR